MPSQDKKWKQACKQRGSCETDGKMEIQIVDGGPKQKNECPEKGFESATWLNGQYREGMTWWEKLNKYCYYIIMSVIEWKK